MIIGIDSYFWITIQVSLFSGHNAGKHCHATIRSDSVVAGPLKASPDFLVRAKHLSEPWRAMQVASIFYWD